MLAIQDTALQCSDIQCQKYAIPFKRSRSVAACEVTPAGRMG